MDNKNTRIIFFGTPQFAVPSLEKIIEAGFDVIAVVTQPDKPKGRNKNILTPPPVKTYAEKRGVRVLQPAKITDEAINEIATFNSELFVLVAYGKILPQALLDLPKHGTVNIHFSLLPKYRGASPYQSAILNGDRITGVTIALLVEKLDSGPILNQVEVVIAENETAETLLIKSCAVANSILVETINDYLQGNIKPQEQDHDQATYCKMIKKEDGKIDWDKQASYIERMTRAYYPWPSTYAFLAGSGLKPFPTNQVLLIKIIEAAAPDKTSNKPPGTFFTKDNVLYVVCGENSVLEIKKLQPSGKRLMTGAEFIKGYSRYF